jgi:DNA-binding NarL/FixJ family response regulator
MEYRTISPRVPMKLMIVDNDPTMRQVIRGIVARPEDVVVECSDGDEVVKTFDAFHADWVLMDIQMSRMSGLQATRALKTAFPEARIAILTNYGDAEFREEARSAGAERYFLKDNIPLVRFDLEA